jgi:hypothetical protein
MWKGFVMIDSGEPEEWSLGPAERIDLVATDRSLRGPGETRAVLSAMTFFAPRVCLTNWHDDEPAGRITLPRGTRTVELRYGVEFDLLPRGQGYRTADLTVTLPDDCRVVAAQGSRDEVDGCRFRQHLDRPSGGHTIRTRLIVEIPEGRLDLSGSMTCEINLSRGIGARVHRVPAVAVKETSFISAVPVDQVGPAVRLFVAADLVGFGLRSPNATSRAQRGTAEVVDRAARATGIELDDRQVHGDSLQLAFRPAIDERTVLRSFYIELSAALREHNRDLTPEAALRLRVGIDRGLTDRTTLGWDRAAPVAAARLRDCADARAAVTNNPKASFVLVVSDVLYRDIFSDPDHEPPGTSFTEIAVDEPAKRFSAKAWLHVADG